jgi:trimeric autotransporter adhesin
VETWANSAGTAGSTGDGGAAVSALLNQPNGMVVHQDAVLLVVETGAHVIRAIDLTTRIITRWAGTGTASSTGDGLDKLSATFSGLYGIAALPNGDVLVASYGGCRVTRITAAGIVRPFAGTGGCTTTGDGSSALSATINRPVGVAVDNSTGVTTVYITDNDGHRVSCQAGAIGRPLSHPRSPPVWPLHVQVRAVRWEPDACTAGLISHTGTGTLTPTQSASRTASATTTRSPSLSPSPASVCNIRTVAGTGAASSTGDGGQASSATLHFPPYAIVNGTSLLIAEYAGARVRSVDLATGVITTLAGTGSATGAYIGVAATSANLGAIISIMTLPGGAVSVAGRDRCSFVGVTPHTRVTYAIAGTGTCLSAGQAASSGVAANSTAFGQGRFQALWGVDGLFVSTELDHRVRLVNLTTGACV